MTFHPSERINLHTHTNYCDHAVGSVQDYVDSAIAAGLEVLGFTEHAPVAGDPISCNMMCRDLDSYVRDVRDAGKRNPIHILLGGECDFEPILINYYKEELLGRCGFDYLLCSVHLYFDHDARQMRFVSKSKDFTPYLRDYVARYCCALESGLFLFGCHPDLYRASYLEWDDNAKSAAKDILQCAHELDIPLEINEAGLQKPLVNKRQPYSTTEFFELAKDIGVRIILSSDAHDPKLVAENTKSRELAKNLGIDPLGCVINANHAVLKSSIPA